MEPYALPHGAKGIEGDGFAVEFRADKIVFVPKAYSKATHYTLHTGANSGVIDLHATGGDGETHRTLFAIRKDDLFGLLQEMAPIVPELLGLLRPLRLGWLKHRNIGIARGIEPVANAEIAAVTRKRKKRLTLDPELYCQNIDCPEFLEDVFYIPVKNYFVSDDIIARVYIVYEKEKEEQYSAEFTEIAAMLQLKPDTKIEGHVHGPDCGHIH